MKSNVLTIETDQGQVDQAMEWLLRLPQLPPERLPSASEVSATVAALSEPANPAWCMARVAALLNPYYEKDTPQSVREMEAEDWLESLAGYSQWALERAARWWKSDANPDRRKRPLEGDIAARCKIEMRGIGAIPQIMEMKVQGRWRATQAEPERKRMSKEDAARIMAEAGFKRMGE